MIKPLRYYLLFFLALGSFLFSAYQVKASHYVGSDVIFTYTGTPGFYHIKLKVYRDCGGITCNNTVALGGVSSCGTATVQLMQTSITEASEVCPSQLTECSGNNSIPGVQLVEYEATVQLPPCSDWLFTFNGNARN